MRTTNGRRHTNRESTLAASSTIGAPGIGTRKQHGRREVTSAEKRERAVQELVAQPRAAKRRVAGGPFVGPSTRPVEEGAHPHTQRKRPRKDGRTGEPTKARQVTTFWRAA
jgi:hypothetical protein